MYIVQCTSVHDSVYYTLYNILQDRDWTDVELVEIVFVGYSSIRFQTSSLLAMFA